jgi:adenylate cyclase
VVVGRIGKTSDQTTPSRLTAIGETVNIAARLEAATKELSASLVISAHTFDLAGIAITEKVGMRSKIQVRNITEPVDVVAVREWRELESILGNPLPEQRKKVRRDTKGAASNPSA